MVKRSNSRLLITGGSSYLGQHLVPMAVFQFETTYTYFKNDPLRLENGVYLDVRQETAVARLIHQIQPQAIIHTAGSNRGSDMADVIRQGSLHVTRAAQAVGARLIHLSTDSIFRGDTAPYDETADPDPLNEYGRAKADAEAVVKLYPQAVIVRTSLIYDLKQMDHGTTWMAAALRAGKPVTLFDNQIRNPIWVKTLAAACLELVAHDFRGILNVAGSQALSRSDFALRMLDYWNVLERGSLSVGPYTGNEWPLNCEMDLRLATAVLQTPLPGVDQILQRARRGQLKLPDEENESLRQRRKAAK